MQGKKSFQISQSKLGSSIQDKTPNSSMILESPLKRNLIQDFRMEAIQKTNKNKSKLIKQQMSH